LLEQTAEYHRLVYGENPGPNAAEELFEEVPPGQSRANKRFFGLWRGDQLFGLLDVFEAFRQPDECYLGLLLLHPEARERGVGAEVLAAVERWLATRQIARLRLACAEQNLKGMNFWRRSGFVVAETFPPRQLGARLTTLVELVKSLP
jgi:GNAT superfamily N-acetyltransferase